MGNSRNIAVLLLVIQILTGLSPLAALALDSPVIAHAVTGKCTGDCSLCGCAPERSAARTCCCWKKKLRERHEDDGEEVPSCCRKVHKEADKIPVCSEAPCGSDTLFAFWGMESPESILSVTRIIQPVIHPETLIPLPLSLLSGRSVDPPVPPPKITFPV